MPKPFATAQRSSALYQTAEWRALRAAHLAREPYCRVCSQAGRLVRATFVDHVTPHLGDEAAFWAGPFQSLCRPHSNAKTGSETRDRLAPRRRPPEAHPGEVPAATVNDESPPTTRRTWPVWHGRELVMLMGPPGSGKSTFARRFPLVVTTDDLRTAAGGGAIDAEAVNAVYEAGWARVIRALKANRRVVFDSPATSGVTRRHALAIARGHRAKATLVIFTTPLALCISRQEGREHPVPTEVVQEMHAAIAAQRATVESEGWMSIVEMGT